MQVAIRNVSTNFRFVYLM